MAADKLAQGPTIRRAAPASRRRLGVCALQVRERLIFHCIRTDGFVYGLGVSKTFIRFAMSGRIPPLSITPELISEAVREFRKIRSVAPY